MDAKKESPQSERTRCEKIRAMRDSNPRPLAVSSYVLWHLRTQNAGGQGTTIRFSQAI
jgi:hypothetical protein